MFSKLGHIFSKIWDALKRVLAIILIVIAIILICFATFGTGLLVIPFLGIALTPTMALVAGLLALTCAFVVDADTSSEVVGKIGEAAGDAAKSVGGAVGSVVGGAVSGILDSPAALWIIGGVVTYYLLTSSSGQSEPGEKKKKVETVSDRSRPDDARVAGNGDNLASPELGGALYA